MIPEGDLEIRTWPDPGRGGQHVGIVTGVKITHLPSGIEAYVNIHRSQFKNKAIAMDMIMAAITNPYYR